MSNRRAFVTATTGGVLLAGLGAAAPAAAEPTPEDALRRVGGSPSRASFEGVRGESLELTAADGAQARVELVEVSGSGIAQPGLEQFSLALRAPADGVPGGLYQVHHPRLGQFAMYIDAASRDEEGLLMNAHFSLLT